MTGEFDRSGRTVILVHGVCAHPWYMWTLARRLRQRGYSVINWGYRSLFRELDFHGKNLARCIVKVANEDDVRSIEIVAHSMGAIVSRSALREIEANLDVLSKVRSAVFLTPPNRGSPVADFLVRGLGWLLPPSRQLRTDKESYVNQLPSQLPIPLGVIAAKSDFIIPLELTHLAESETRSPYSSRYSLISGLPERCCRSD